MEMKDLFIPDEISLALDKVVEQANPVSIFVYGSRARDDYKEYSDFEIGVLFNRDKIRKGLAINPELFYKNITFLNQIVYSKIRSEFLNGDKVILPGHSIS